MNKGFDLAILNFSETIDVLIETLQVWAMGSLKIVAPSLRILSVRQSIPAALSFLVFDKILQTCSFPISLKEKNLFLTLIFCCLAEGV